MIWRVARLLLALLALWGAAHAEAAIAADRDDRQEISTPDSVARCFMTPSAEGRDLVRPPGRVAARFQRVCLPWECADDHARGLTFRRANDSRSAAPHRMLMRHRQRPPSSDDPAA